MSSSLSSAPSPGPPIVKIYLVRHGETQENKDLIIQGQLDTKLNETGLQQAALVAEAFKDVPLTAAFSSDLERARKVYGWFKTAESILKHHPSVQLVLQSELRERFMGNLQGRKVDRGRPKLEGMHVESSPDFIQRIMLWWDVTVANNLSAIPVDIDIVHVLIVSHGAFIATLVRTLFTENIISSADIELRDIRSCFNTSVTTIEMRRDKRGVLKKYSDISHLVMPVVQTNADENPQG